MVKAEFLYGADQPTPDSPAEPTRPFELPSHPRIFPDSPEIEPAGPFRLPRREVVEEPKKVVPYREAPLRSIPQRPLQPSRHHPEVRPLSPHRRPQRRAA